VRRVKERANIYPKIFLPAAVAELLSDVEIRNAKSQDKPRKLCEPGWL
jgi:hypothetical protein